jgi:putative transcriptional regulator
MKKQKPHKLDSVGAQIIERLTDFADVLEKSTDISQRFRLRRVQLDLQPAHYDRKSIKKVRAVLGASQAVFARFLGVSVKTVQAWEQGINTPTEIARRFMDEIRQNPQYWRRRLNGSLVAKRNRARPGKQTH